MTSMPTLENVMNPHFIPNLDFNQLQTLNYFDSIAILHLTLGIVGLCQSRGSWWRRMSILCGVHLWNRGHPHKFWRFVEICKDQGQYAYHLTITIDFDRDVPAFNLSFQILFFDRPFGSQCQYPPLWKATFGWFNRKMCWLLLVHLALYTRSHFKPNWS